MKINLFSWKRFSWNYDLTYKLCVWVFWLFLCPRALQGFRECKSTSKMFYKWVWILICAWTESVSGRLLASPSRGQSCEMSNILHWENLYLSNFTHLNSMEKSENKLYADHNCCSWLSIFYFLKNSPHDTFQLWCRDGGRTLPAEAWSQMGWFASHNSRSHSQFIWLLKSQQFTTSTNKHYILSFDLKDVPSAKGRTDTITTLRFKIFLVRDWNSLPSWYFHQILWETAEWITVFLEMNWCSHSLDSDLCKIFKTDLLPNHAGNLPRALHQEMATFFFRINHKLCIWTQF